MFKRVSKWLYERRKKREEELTREYARKCWEPTINLLQLYIDSLEIQKKMEDELVSGRTQNDRVVSDKR